MMQPEIQKSQWSFHEVMNSTFDELVEPYDFTIDDYVGECGTYGFAMDDHVGDCGFNTLFRTPQDSASEVFSIPFPNTMLTNDHIQYPIEQETLQLPSLMEDFPMELDDFDSILNAQVVGIDGYGCQEESEGSFPSQNLSSEVEDAWSPTPSVKSQLSSIQPSPTLPQEGMEIDNQVSLPHLMEACGEAMEQAQKALAEVILRCISQKVSPLGESLERLAFYLSQDMTNQGENLKGEAFKNFEASLRAFYQGLPNGKVAHFAAVSAVLEAIPEDCDVIHIIDFDMGQGIQWPPMIEAIACLHKTLKLTSIKWGDESPESLSTPWTFEEIRRQLYEHAKSCGLKLKVEEKGVEELITEMKKMNKRGGKREFLAFNCMVGLPHMGRVMSRRHVLEFLSLAKDLINNSGNRGIVTFGDGDAFEKVKNSLNFRSFFNGHLVHYQALLESIESHFTTHLSVARTGMECLFVAPHISSLAWLQTWEEMKRDCNLHADISMEGCRLSKKILMEVTEVLRGSEGSYQARIEGQNGNELVIEWKGTQLLRFSTWKI
ncbi:protein NODULATION SIGNALING PATHWAY 2-like [Gastrolobium bilobum]|uniref:protein NODULATION SIGNALING PATHWAY 2-like n=1 Tax=Gastrolobium bilobum TaxID=150636 RepID=UPI002AB1ED73|nr:protein NODULATION SIGNALING PATHWAY 2-like [Gastrolobium bilobum]